MKILLFLFCSFIISFPTYAQEEIGISFWSDVMINANSSNNRSIALDSFQAKFSELLENDNAFEYDFSKTPELTVLSDSLNTFKFISWQIKISEKEYDYYGYIIHKNGLSYALNDAFLQLDDIDYLEVDHNEWLGGIYYNMIEVDGKYFVFSYRQLDNYTKFKSFDVLSFDENGQPRFGEEIFLIPGNETRDLLKNRITFTYSADAILSLNYNPQMNMVVNDHLMQVMGQLEGQGPTMVPDGTYEGFIYREGKWVYEEKLFSHTYDEAPRPKQILGKSNKDVFGNERKNK